jgi:hypothetical protein
MENNPYESPRTFVNAQMSGDVNAGQKKLRAIMALSIYLLVAILGAMQAIPTIFLDRSPVFLWLIPIMMAYTATYWCVVDSRILGRPIVQSLHWIIFFTWPLAVPIYLIYSRGGRGLVLVILHTIGLIVVCNIAFHLAGFLAYGVMWFDRVGI